MLPALLFGPVGTPVKAAFRAFRSAIGSVWISAPSVRASATKWPPVSTTATVSSAPRFRASSSTARRMTVAPSSVICGVIFVYMRGE
jgi:hypothetical protein